jgi:serine/threonine protein kinase
MLSRDEFLEALRRVPLLDTGKIETLTQDSHAQTLSAGALGEQLVARGALTPYQVEEVLAGRGQELRLGPYVVLGCLGQGGMGAVYKAHHAELDRIAAVKVIRSTHLHSPAATERFKREARAAAQLRHPNVVLVYDAGETASGVRFLAMEYVEGTDLGMLVKQHGPLPVLPVCDYIRQAALGLQHLHEHGLVHRDIKPSNLLLQQPGPGDPPTRRTIKIVDLGLVRLQTGADGEQPATMTASGSVMGTPDYLAPEQALDAHSVDIRADLYSLGCTMYYLLTGQAPFPGTVVTEKLVAHQMYVPAPVTLHRPETPQAIVDVVDKLMAKKPEDRYQTPALLAAALARIIKGEPKAPVPKPPAPPPRRRAPAVQPKVSRPPEVPKPVRKSGQGLVFGVLAGLGLIIVGCLVVLFLRPWSNAMLQPVTNTLGMDFVYLEPDSFDMGSLEKEQDHQGDELRHRVTLTKPFWMQTTLVTQKQWNTVMGQSNNPSHFVGDDLPVDSASWHDAMEFCKKLNEKEHRRDDYRLPYEAEWEYAARAGTKTPFWQGETITPKEANYDGNYPYRSDDPKGAYRERTTPVRTFSVNAWKLHDMGGNLSQWCMDWYERYPDRAASDPKGASDGTGRVLRGGSWFDFARYCRVARRDACDPGVHSTHYGFRVVLPGTARAP